MVLATHNLRLARAVADECLLLIQGSMVETADTESLFDRPTHPRTLHYVRMGS